MSDVERIQAELHRWLKMAASIGVSGRAIYDRTRKALDDAFQAGVAAGRSAQLDECETCGGSGAMEVDHGEGIPLQLETCGECHGTTIGGMGQMLRDEYERGKADALAAHPERKGR